MSRRKPPTLDQMDLPLPSISPTIATAAPPSLAPTSRPTTSATPARRAPAPLRQMELAVVAPPAAAPAPLAWAFTRPLVLPPAGSAASVDVALSTTEDWIEARMAYGMDRAGQSAATEALAMLVERAKTSPDFAQATLALRAALRDTAGQLPPPLTTTLPIHHTAAVLEAWLHQPEPQLLAERLRASGLPLGPEPEPVQAWAHVPWEQRRAWAAACCQAAGVLIPMDAVSVFESLQRDPQRWRVGLAEERDHAEGRKLKGWSARPEPGARIEPHAADALWRRRDVAWWDHYMTDTPAMVGLVTQHAMLLPPNDPRTVLSVWSEWSVAPSHLVSHTERIAAVELPEAVEAPHATAPASPPADLPSGWGFRQGR